MSADFIEPHPLARTALSGAALFVLAAGFVIDRYSPEFNEYVASIPVCERIVLFYKLMAFTCLVLVIPPTLFTRTAVGMLRFSQSPPPGSWVIRRTAIVRGPDIKTRAYYILAAVIVIYVCIAFFAFTLLSPLIKASHAYCHGT